MSDKDIEDCHRVGKRGTTIVKFCRKKVSKQVSNVRKDLTKLSMEDLQLTGQGKLYINQSLCPYYRGLLSKSKSLHRMGKIFSYYVSNGTVKIKIQETSKSLSVRQYESNSMTKVLLSPEGNFLIISIGMKQLDIVIGNSVLGVVNIPILNLAIIQDICYVPVFLLVLFVCCSPHPICFRSQN